MASHMNSVKRLVAYFSMEIALENAMPSYSGGLGVLAGDTIRAAADLRLPMVEASENARAQVKKAMQGAGIIN